MARQTTQYKNTQTHRVRNVTTESNFSKGVKWTTSPLEEDYLKSMINYNFKEDGAKLVPRGGEQPLGITPASIGAVDDDAHTISTFEVYAEDALDTGIVYTVQCALISSAAGTKLAIKLGDNIAVSTISKYIDVEGATHSATTISVRVNSGVDSCHGMECTGLTTLRAIDAVLEGNYYCVLDGIGFSRLHTVLDSDDGVPVSVNDAYFEVIVPYEVQPAQAINFGYNMLKSNPYTFTNTKSPYNDIQLTGVVPYNSEGDLLLSARPGTEITFKLSYKYPQQDIDNDEQYRVQWELQDNTAGTIAQIIQKWDASPSYAPGDDISLTHTPSQTNFSLIVRVFRQSEIDAQIDEWENNVYLQSVCSKEDFVTPAQVTTLASYYLTNTTDSSSLNAQPVVYDITTATGMCVWNHHIVAWGVDGAKSSIFVSEVNRPDYFPYPNGVELFDTDVVCCVPYLKDLLVFTKTTLYKCTWQDDGVTYISEVIQANLIMEPQDSGTVVTVQNMVYFRTGDKYYMVVPNYSMNSGQYGVQLAPVSRPLDTFYNDFEASIRSLLTSTHFVEWSHTHNPLIITLLGYSIYVAGSQIHNVYKVSADSRIFDVHVIYDSVLRAWTFWLVQTDATSSDAVLIKSATGDNTFLRIQHTYTDTVIYEYIFDENNIVPFSNVTWAWLTHYQPIYYIDTGYRNFADNLKKRFREMQFFVNVLDQNTQLEFDTGFTVDGDEEQELWKYNVEFETDQYSPTYGTMIVTREVNTDESRQLTPLQTVLDKWILDTSTAPYVDIYKVRDHVWGKGYGGSYTILCTAKVPFELLNISFVYRLMWSR